MVWYDMIMNMIVIMIMIIAAAGTVDVDVAMATTRATAIGLILRMLFFGHRKYRCESTMVTRSYTFHVMTSRTSKSCKWAPVLILHPNPCETAV